MVVCLRVSYNTKGYAQYIVNINIVLLVNTVFGLNKLSCYSLVWAYSATYTYKGWDDRVYLVDSKVHCIQEHTDMKTDSPDPGKYHHVDIPHHCIHWYLNSRRWQQACHYPMTRVKDDNILVLPDDRSNTWNSELRHSFQSLSCVQDSALYGYWALFGQWSTLLDYVIFWYGHLHETISIKAK